MSVIVNILERLKNFVAVFVWGGAEVTFEVGVIVYYHFKELGQTLVSD